MEKIQKKASDAIESAVRKILGLRVRSVASEQKINDDGAAIVRVRIVYDASRGLSVEEMESTADEIWQGMTVEGAPFPVIDFQEDTDLDSVAAE